MNDKPKKPETPTPSRDEGSDDDVARIRRTWTIHMPYTAGEDDDESADKATASVFLPSRLDPNGIADPFYRGVYKFALSDRGEWDLTEASATSLSRYMIDGVESRYEGWKENAERLVEMNREGAVDAAEVRRRRQELIDAGEKPTKVAGKLAPEFGVTPTRIRQLVNETPEDQKTKT